MVADQRAGRKASVIAEKWFRRAAPDSHQFTERLYDRVSEARRIVTAGRDARLPIRGHAGKLPADFFLERGVSTVRRRHSLGALLPYDAIAQLEGDQ